MLRRFNKKQFKEKIKRVRKVVYWKSLVPDDKTLALSNVIIPDFVEQKFLPSKQRNMSSLCHKM